MVAINMTKKENELFVRNMFEQAKPRLAKLVGRVTDAEPASIIEEAETIFNGMVPDLAYIDTPRNPMAPSLFFCCIDLALYLALKSKGVGVHEYGTAMLNALAQSAIHPRPLADTEESRAGFTQMVNATQVDPAPGEFVLENVPGKEASFDSVYDITSCAVCHEFAKHDAMDLVPYMCATDDVMSDKGKQGLQRTGSVALGADRCDFRYKMHGEPKCLAEQYPHLIHVSEQS